MQIVDSQPAVGPPVEAARTSPKRLLQVAGALAALGLAFLAQRFLSDRTAALDALVFFAVAVFVFVKTLAPYSLLQATIARPLPAPLVLYWPVAGYAAVILAALTFLTAGGNTVRPVTLVCWVGAILAALYAASDPRPDLRAWAVAVVNRLRRPPATLQVNLRVSRLAVLVIGVVLVSAFYHYYQLNTIPVDTTSDHAEKFLDVQDMLDGWHPWFFPRNTGREPLQFYFLLAVAAVRGVDHLTLKLVSAGAGTFVALGCFLLARQFFGNGVGLATAFLAAVGKWEVTTARVGLRVPFAALCSAFSLYFLFRALRYGQRRDFLLLGLGLGIGLYSYIPFRITVPVFVALALALTMALRWRDGWPTRLDLMRNGALCYAIAAIVFLPLARYAVDYPESFWERGLSRLVAGSGAVENPLTAFLGNLVAGALMFNWQGDVVWVNNVPLDPVLDPVTGALFVLGVAYALVRLVLAREWIYAYLLLALPVLTLGTTGAIGWPGENPSVFRAIPAVPVVYLFAALALVLAVRQVRTLLGRPAGPVLAAALLAVALGLAAYLNWQTYFVTYAEQYRRTAHNSREMGPVVRGFSESIGSYEQAYHVPYPHWVDTRNVGVAAGNPHWLNALNTDDKLREAAQGPTPQLYLVHPSDAVHLQMLRELRPEGHVQLHRSEIEGRDFIVYFVPPPPG